MELRAPETIFASVKAERGLAGDAYVARADTFVIGILASLEGVRLKAGEETPVTVQIPNLPPNANIQTVTATLTVVDDGTTGGAQTTSVGIAEGNDSRSFKVSVDSVAGIRNVQIRLNQGSVFWTHPGIVPAGDYTLPDFAAQANAYLDKFQSKDGKVSLQFQVKSDVAGTVRIQINGDPQYTMLQTQSWRNALDSTFRVDRTLPVIFNQVETLVIDPVTPSPGHQAVVSTISLDVGGKFGPDRLLGAVEIHDGRQFATVSPDFSIAQVVTFAKSILKTAIQSTGIAGYFEADDKAEFYLELQNDQAGSPANDAPLAKSNVAFAPADKGDLRPWTFAKFEQPAQLKPDTPYWIVAKGVRGAVRLGLKAATGQDPSAAPFSRGGLLLNRGGLIWKALSGPTTSPLEALVSPVYVPQSDNQTAAIEISVSGGGGPQQIDPQSAAKTVTIPIVGPLGAAPTLTIDSRGLGTVTIANVIQEYRLS